MSWLTQHSTHAESGKIEHPSVTNARGGSDERTREQCALARFSSRALA
jgi:hypothetical protein